MEEREILLRVEHLYQHFGDVRAVDDVSFDIHRGEVFGLVGESGCGKTTTGRCIMGLYPITSGSISFDGRRIAAGTADLRQKIRELKSAARQLRFAGTADAQQQIQAWREEIKNLKQQIAAAQRDTQRVGTLTQIQMVFQDPMASLDPRMTVREIIAEGVVVAGERDRRILNQKVSEILETVGLRPEYADRYPHEFSGGQRQRIGIARAVIMNPKLLIADEPISALDVSVQAQVINLLDDLRKKMGLTVLFIAHDLSVVKYFSDRIGVMYLGQLVELAPADALFACPLHPYTRSLLSAIPLPDPRSERCRVRVPYEIPAASDIADPSCLQEVRPGHFVRCTRTQLEQYRRQLEAT